MAKSPFDEKAVAILAHDRAHAEELLKTCAQARIAGWRLGSSPGGAGADEATVIGLFKCPSSTTPAHEHLVNQDPELQRIEIAKFMACSAPRFERQHEL